MRTRVFAVAVLITLIVAPARASTQATADDLDSLLKLPPTPASIALLLSHAADARVQERLIAALRDDKPEMRLVAARIAFAVHAAALVPVLLDALDREQDVRAGVEEVRAAVDLGSVTTDARVLAAVKRLGDPVPRVFLIALSRTRPGAVLAYVPDLAPKFRHPPSAGAVMAMAVIRQPTLIEPALDILAASADDREHDLVPAFFDALDYADPDGVAIVTRALQSPSERVRCGAIWQAGVSFARGEQVNDSILSAIASTPAAPGSRDGFARDLLARVSKSSEPAATWLPILRDKNWRVPDLLQIWLTKEEFAVLKPVLGNDKQQGKYKPTTTAYVPPETLRLRSVSALPAALLDEVLTLSGCTNPASLKKAGAQLKYADSGRPISIAMALDHPVPECSLALRTIANLMIARDDEPRPARAVDVVVLEISHNLAACARSGPIVPIAVPITGDKSLPRPTVKHEQRPDFPDGARARKVQGTPWVRAVVTTKGCVTEMDVVRRVDPELDLAALAAVSKWQFDPIPLDASLAVDVVIEVSFTLGR